MSWNYRIVRLANGYHYLYEVYYDENSRPIGRTLNPVAAGGETPDELIDDLRTMLRDAENRYVMDEADFSKGV